MKQTIFISSLPFCLAICISLNLPVFAQSNILLHPASSDQSREDYRDPFLGDYTGKIYVYKWFTDDTAYYDTISGNINVSEFLGYTAGNDSNYIDIEHKLGITYSSYDTTHDDSWCADLNYYTDGFLHPTVDTSGELTYPELTSCQSGFIEGYCDGDSISILYWNYNMWKGFTRTVRGKRISGSQAPDYFEDDPQWRMNWANGAQMPCLELHDYVYYLSGDSVIGDLTYKKVFERGQVIYEWMDSPPAYNCDGSYIYDEFQILIRQEGMKMFVRDNNGNDTLLYDFDLEVGDTLPVSYNLSMDNIVVTGIDSLLVGTSYRKVFEIPDYNPAGNNLIEGIGFTTGLLDFFYCPEFPTVLECFVQNDTTYFPAFGEPCDLAVKVQDLTSDSVIRYYPNPVNSKLVVLPDKPAKVSHVICISSDGRRTDMEFEQHENDEIIIDLSAILSGLYIIQLQTNDDSVINLKVLKLQD